MINITKTVSEGNAMLFQDRLTIKILKLPAIRNLAFVGLYIFSLFAALSGPHPVQAATGQDCDSNAVIYCGVSTLGDLQSKYTNGDGQHSGGNIQHIYNWFGISDNNIQSLDTTAKNGKVTDKGNVYIGDDIVATDAITAGRQNISEAPGSTEVTSKDTTFYTRPPSVSFASQSLDAYVIMKDGVFQFAVIKSCGNPVKATAKEMPAPQPKPTPPAPTPPAPAPAPAPVAPQPTAVCSGDTANSNTGIASQGGNCSINTTTVVQQTEPTPPTEQPSPNPAAQCTSLQIIANPNNSGAMSVKASVNYSTQNGAQLQNIAYDFGDGTTSSPTTQTNMTHTYQQPGSYTIKATLSFKSGETASTAAAATTSSVALASTASNGILSSVCQADVTVAPNPTPPPTPTPPTVTTTSTPTPTVVAPTKLVNTGPSNIAGIFGLTVLTSAFIYRLYLRRRLSA